MNKRWTDIEKNYIEANAGKMTDAAIAKEISILRGTTVSRDCVRKMRQRLGIKKKHGRSVCALQEKDFEKKEQI